MRLPLLPQVAFGEDLSFLGISAPSPLYAAFMGVLQDVAFYLDNVQVGRGSLAGRCWQRRGRRRAEAGRGCAALLAPGTRRKEVVELQAASSRRLAQTPDAPAQHVQLLL